MLKVEDRAVDKLKIFLNIKQIRSFLLTFNHLRNLYCLANSVFFVVLFRNLFAFIQQMDSKCS